MLVATKSVVVSEKDCEEKVVSSVTRTSSVEVSIVEEPSETGIEEKVVENSSSDKEGSVVGATVAVGSLVKCEKVVDGNSVFISSKISVVGTFGGIVEEAIVSLVNDSVTIVSEMSSDVSVNIASVVKSVECSGVGVVGLSVSETEESVNVTASDTGCEVVEKASLVEDPVNWLVDSASVVTCNSDVESSEVLDVGKSGDTVEIIVASLLDDSEVIVCEVSVSVIRESVVWLMESDDSVTIISVMPSEVSVGNPSVEGSVESSSVGEEGFSV